MGDDLRNKVTRVGQKALDIVEEYFDGKREGTDKVALASKAISQAIKVEHMNQLKEQNIKSFGLRLLPWLPGDEETKRKYIEMTNPEVSHLLKRKR